MLNLIAALRPGNLGGERNGPADGSAKRAKREIEILKYIVQIERVSVAKGALEQRFRYLEADKIVIGGRREMALGNLKDIEAELGLYVSDRIVLICDDIAEFLAQARVKHGHHMIGGDAMTVVVGNIVRQSSQRESAFVHIMSLRQQVGDEVAATHVMGKVAEQLVAEGIVAHVLNDGSAVSVGVRSSKLGGRSAWITGQQKTFNIRIPERVDDGFVRENRIRPRGARKKNKKEDRGNQASQRSVRQRPGDTPSR